jgi:hypothetical protein
MSGRVLRTSEKERLKIFNRSEEPDGAAGLKRESFAMLDAIDDTPGERIRLALRLRLKPKRQEVGSLELFDGTRWNQLVGASEDASVSADAEDFWQPPDPNFYWHGYLFPANWVQRPFQGGFTRLDFGPAHSSKQRIDWLVNYEGNVFGDQHIIGHSDIKVHVHSRRGTGANKPVKRPGGAARRREPRRGRS